MEQWKIFWLVLKEYIGMNRSSSEIPTKKAPEPNDESKKLQNESNEVNLSPISEKKTAGTIWNGIKEGILIDFIGLYWHKSF